MQRFRLILVLLLAGGLQSGCAALFPEDEEEEEPPPRQVARLRTAPATAMPTPTATFGRLANAAQHPTQRPLEDNEMEERPAATPGPQLAAIAPPAAVPPDSAAIVGQSPSLLPLITSSTPPNVAAALRLIDDGRRQMELGKAPQALERYERGLAIDPSNVYGYYYLAQLHLLNKRYDQASAFISRAVGLGPRADRVWQARIYSLQGQIFEEIGRYPDARAAYQKAVGVDPGNAAARLGMARLSQP